MCREERVAERGAPRRSGRLAEVEGREAVARRAGLRLEERRARGLAGDAQREGRGARGVPGVLQEDERGGDLVGAPERRREALPAEGLGAVQPGVLGAEGAQQPDEGRGRVRRVAAEGRRAPVGRRGGTRGPRAARSGRAPTAPRRKRGSRRGRRRAPSRARPPRAARGARSRRGAAGSPARARRARGRDRSRRRGSGRRGAPRAPARPGAPRNACAKRARSRSRRVAPEEARGTLEGGDAMRGMMARSSRGPRLERIGPSARKAQQRGGRKAREAHALAGQVRLVGVAGAEGELCEAGAAHGLPGQREEALETQHALEASSGRSRRRRRSAAGAGARRGVGGTRQARRVRASVRDAIRATATATLGIGSRRLQGALEHGCAPARPSQLGERAPPWRASARRVARHAGPELGSGTRRSRISARGDAEERRRRARPEAQADVRARSGGTRASRQVSGPATKGATPGRPEEVRAAIRQHARRRLARPAAGPEAQATASERGPRARARRSRSSTLASQRRATTGSVRLEGEGASAARASAAHPRPGCARSGRRRRRRARGGSRWPAAKTVGRRQQIEAELGDLARHEGPRVLAPERAPREARARRRRGRVAAVERAQHALGHVRPRRPSGATSSR